MGTGQEGRLGPRSAGASSQASCGQGHEQLRRIRTALGGEGCRGEAEAEGPAGQAERGPHRGRLSAGLRGLECHLRP